MMSTETVCLRVGLPAPVAREIEDTCIRYGITTMLQKAHFIAQMCYESNYFKTLREGLNYSADSLIKRFSRERISVADAQKYGRTTTHPANQQAIANLIYGGEWGRRKLGNTQPGDGWKFAGKGGKQLTGRDNVTRYSRDTYGDDRVVRNPDLLLELPDAVRSGGWYWKVNRLGVYADANDFLAVSRGVNLGNPKSDGWPNGWKERETLTKRVIAEFTRITQ